MAWAASTEELLTSENLGEPVLVPRQANNKLSHFPRQPKIPRVPTIYACGCDGDHSRAWTIGGQARPGRPISQRTCRRSLTECPRA